MAGPDIAALVACTILFAISTTLLCTRMYVRGCRLHNVGVDDILCCLAGVFNIGVTICLGLKVVYGYRAQNWHDDPKQTRIAALAYYLSMPFYQCALGFIKVSVIFQYRRIFADAVRRACIIMFVLVICNTVAFFLIMVFRCSPIDGLWTNQPTVCLDARTINYVFVPLNFLTDILLLLLPIPAIRNLNLCPAAKRGLIFVFGLGGFAALTSILRLQFVIPLGSNSDHTFNNNGLLMWCCIEISVSISCACMPSLNIILSRFYPQAWRKSPSYHSGWSGWTPRKILSSAHTTFRSEGAAEKELSTVSTGGMSTIEVITTVEQKIESSEEIGQTNNAQVDPRVLGCPWALPPEDNFAEGGSVVTIYPGNQGKHSNSRDPRWKSNS